MGVDTTATSRWPARMAYTAAAIFMAASGGTNLIYGWQKGGDLAGSLVWSGVSLGVSIVFALSWPAVIRSVESRRWSAGVIAIVALSLSGAYSVMAALGSASGGRANAATVETAVTDARTKAQAAYDAAKTELDALAAAKPAIGLQALIEATKAELAKLAPGRSVAEVEVALRAAYRDPNRYSCAFINGSLGMSCPKLDGELARARQRERLTVKIAGWTGEMGKAEQRWTEQRARLKADMDRASSELASIRPAKQANSDARTLARYMQALGVNTTPEHLNDLLVLLAVLMIEAGGGLSLAIGMALSGPVRTPAAAPACVAAVQAERPPAARLDARTTLDALPVRPVVSVERTRPASVVRAEDVATWLAERGGKAATSMRRLASELGRSPSGVHDAVRRMVTSGALTATPGPRGTVMALQLGWHTNPNR